VTVTGASTEGPLSGSSGNIPNQPGMAPGADGKVYFNFTSGTYTWAGMACW
jgi:hypothetical protein